MRNFSKNLIFPENEEDSVHGVSLNDEPTERINEIEFIEESTSGEDTEHDTVITTDKIERVPPVGSYVICKFTYNESTKKQNHKYYVGEIINLRDNDCCTVKCMRCKTKSFVYPNIDDINEVNLGALVKVLHQPHVNRGRYTFSNIPSNLTIS